MCLLSLNSPVQRPSSTYKYNILETCVAHSHSVPGIICQFNRMPLRAIQEVFPIKALKAVY